MSYCIPPSVLAEQTEQGDQLHLQVNILPLAVCVPPASALPLQLTYLTAAVSLMAAEK